MASVASHGERSRALAVRHTSRRAIDRARRVPLPLALLLVVALVLGVAWSAATAPLNGPDESSHYAYVQYLAETGHGPQRESGEASFSSELQVVLIDLGLLPLVGHKEARPLWDNLPAAERKIAALGPDGRKNGSGPNPAGNYPPLYYAYGALAYRLSPNQSALGRMTAVRLAGVLLFVLTVALTWLIAAELFARQWLRTVTTALVALQPKLGFMAGVVNPEIFLIAASTGFLYAALRLVRRGPSLGGVLAVVLTTAAGFLAHPRGLALVPAAALAILIAFLRFRPDLRRLALLGGVALAVVAAAGAYTFAYTRAHSTGGAAYGGQASLSGAFNVRQFLTTVWQFYLPKLAFMDPRPGPDYGYRQVYIDSFFGTFASLEVNFRAQIYDVLQIAAGLGLLALYGTVVARFRRVRERWPEVLVLAGTFLSMMVLLHVVSYQSLLGGGQDPVITGRYLLACVAIYAAAAAWVAGSLPRRLGQVLGGVLVGSSALLAVGAIGLSAARFYG